MPFEHRWFIEGRLVYIRQWGTVILEESLAIDDTLIQYGASSPEIVHGIVDTRGAEKFEIDPKALVQNFKERGSPTTGWVLTLRSNKLQALMTEMMAQPQQVKHRAFENLADALAFLADVDESLEALIPTMDVPE